MIRKNLARALSFCLVTGWIACHTSGVTALAAETDTSMTGELAFAQCENILTSDRNPTKTVRLLRRSITITRLRLFPKRATGIRSLPATPLVM